MDAESFDGPGSGQIFINPKTPISLPRIGIRRYSLT
jgi:hypothetical protein